MVNLRTALHFQAIYVYNFGDLQHDYQGKQTPYEINDQRRSA
jgi:hypothetical protein